MLIYCKNNLFVFLFFLFGSILSNIPIKAQSNSPKQIWKDLLIEKKIDAQALNHQSKQIYLIELQEAIRLQEWNISEIEILRIYDTQHILIRSNIENFKKKQTAIKNTWLVNHNWKLSRNLFNYKKNNTNSKEILLVRTTDVEPIKNEFINTTQIKIKIVYQNILSIEGPKKQILEKLLPLPCVQFISQESLDSKTESRVLNMNLNPNKINLIKRYQADLNGLGKTISIKEDLYDENDLDLLGKNIPSNNPSTELNPHTTDMATIIAGNGNSSYSGSGVAEKASLSSSNFDFILPDTALATDIDIQNHSYGTEIEDHYGIFAKEYDQNAFDNADLLHVFSSGNEGKETSTEGVYQNVNAYANLTGNYKMAKNILTIGSVDATGNLWEFSSKGPAHDGRIKPELVAYSTVGTSNAAALVSGAAALLQQSYANLHNQSKPSSALIKALLINAANDVDSTGIDFRTGFGNLDAYRSLKNLQEDLFITDEIQQGEEIKFTINIPDNAQNLKITVVWTDTPAIEDASKALVNDIDMRLVTATGENLLPWVLDHSPNTEALLKTPTRGIDHLNNIEQISLENPTAGNYELFLNGYDISVSPLPFAIAYQWDTKNEFSWTFPTNNDNMPFDGKTTTNFRWESTFANESGILEYSLDQGATWFLLDSNINLQQEYYNWEIPREIEGIAIARMQIANQSFETEKFTISRTPILRVGFDCGDSILLNWNKYQNASYTIFGLIGNQMDSITSTTDTFFVFNKSSFENNYFAVQPRFSQDMPGMKSVTVDYNLLSSGCYVNSFYLENISNEGLNIHLDLGTNYAIDKIIFQRATAGAFIEIGEISQPSMLQLEYLDENPDQGFNQYRAKIVLNNGQIIFSDIASAYFLTTQNYLVFPNPATLKTGFNIFSKDFSSQKLIFELYGNDGRLLLQKTLNTDREFIETKGLSPGVYIYRLSSKDKVENNKIILH